MKTLLIENRSDSFCEFIAGVRNATGTVVAHANSISKGLKLFANPQNNVRIVVFTVEWNRHQAIDFVKKVRSIAREIMVAEPRILILTHGVQPEWVSDALDRLGVDHLLREFPPQVFARLRVIGWQLRTRRGLPTLYITRRHGHVVSIGFLPTDRSSDLMVGPRIRELVHYLSLHPNAEHTTRMLAEELDLSPGSVKTYMFRLREALDRLRRQGKITFSGENIASTERRVGGFTHSLRASIVLLDEQEDATEFAGDNSLKEAVPWHVER